MKVRRLFEAADFASCIHERDRTAIKLHFGEQGNDSYISPVYVRQVVEKIKAAGALPFVTDTNTLYLGSRSNAVDHITTAVHHGFDYAVVGAPVIIADGLCGKNVAHVAIDKKHFKTVTIAGDIMAADSMIVMTHFKGHEVAGFGGALKNLAMGCAPPQGKRAQHQAKPFSIRDHCTGCGKCVEVCPKSAITLVGEKSSIDKNLCIGCFECMTVCPSHAIDIDWETEIPLFTERLIGTTYGAVLGKAGKVGYISFLTGSRWTATVCRGVMLRSSRISASSRQRTRWRSMQRPATSSTSSRGLRNRSLPGTATRARTSLPGCGRTQTAPGSYGMQKSSAWAPAITSWSSSELFL